MHVEWEFSERNVRECSNHAYLYHPNSQFGPQIAVFASTWCFQNLLRVSKNGTFESD